MYTSGNVNFTNAVSAYRCAPRLYIWQHTGPAYSAGDAAIKIYTEPNALPEKAKQYCVDVIILRDMNCKQRRHTNNSMDKENIIGIDALYDSMEKCAKGVRWKGTVAHFRHNWPDEIAKLERELKDGTYKERKQKFFIVTEPKRREIMSIHFRDRVYQRSLNDVGIYPQASRSYIKDNYACQKGKGTQAARDRLKEHLQRFYRIHGTDGYALKIDIKGYYPNMDHEFVEEMLKKYLDPQIYDMAVRVLRNMPREVGFNPGSQIVQIVGITALDEIDHYIKERLRIKQYIRYMDDFILIHESREYLEDCIEKIREKLKTRKMETHRKKTKIQKISDPITFLGFVYRLTQTGKVVILADPAKIKHERKKLKRMAALVEKGKLQKWQVDQHYKAYKASIRYGNSHNLIYRLNRWYESLWKGENNERSIDHQEKQDGDRGEKGSGECTCGG